MPNMCIVQCLITVIRGNWQKIRQFLTLIHLVRNPKSKNESFWTLVFISWDLLSDFLGFSEWCLSFTLDVPLAY